MAAFTVFMLVAMVFVGCYGYGLGPPATVCTEMFPVGHYANASTANAPFEILVNTTTYQPGDVIEVQLNAKNDTQQPDGRDWFYEGVMVQVRSRDCQNERAWGTFTVMADEDFLQPIECFNQAASTIRHYNHAHIYKRTFYWTAPATPVGHVFVRATVARNKALFWMNIFSPVIRDLTDSANTDNIQPCAPRMHFSESDICTTSSAVMFTPPTAMLIAGVLALAGLRKV